MFDATKLLGGLLQGKQSGFAPGGSGGSGWGHMVQQAISQFGGGTSGSGGLGGQRSQIPGSSPQGNAQGAPQGDSFMNQVGELTRRAANAPGAELRNNNPAAMGGLGALAGAMMGGGRGAVGGGLLAVLGSIAYTSWQKQNAATPNTAPLAVPLQAYADPETVQRKARLVLRAMIQATKADGHLDDGEHERLIRQVAGSSDGAEAQAFLDAEIARPLDMEGLAAEVRTPGEAAEIYGASVVAISIDTQAERDYLARLATALKLPKGIVSHVHASLDEAA